MNITCPQCQHSVRDRDRFKPKLFWVCPQCAQEYGLRKTAFDQEYMQEAAKALQTEVTEAGRRYWRKWESNDLVGSLLGFAILGGIAISLSLYLLSIYEDLSPELFELSLESALAWALLGFFSFVILVLGSLALVVLFSWLWTPDITLGPGSIVVCSSPFPFIRRKKEWHFKVKEELEYSMTFKRMRFGYNSSETFTIMVGDRKEEIDLYDAYKDVLRRYLGDYDPGTFDQSNCEKNEEAE